MTQPSILLIDDDPTLLELLGAHLESAGYRVVQAGSGAEGLQRAAETRPGLIVLDVMMPGMDGWQVCEALRRRQATPIILLTAKGEETDKLRGFRLGIDDYVTKPFSFAELTARVGAVLSRSLQPGERMDRVERGGLAIDFGNRRVTLDGRPVELTPTEYRLLEILARHAGRTVPAEHLLLEVWGEAYAGEAAHVKHYIWSLRKKIERDPGDPQTIVTERGFGYRFD